MTPFEDNITNAVTNMLWVKVYDCESYDLARDVLIALRQEPPPEQESGYHIAVATHIRDLLVDALLPESVASNLDCGITARTILDHAIWAGLNLLTLKNSLDTWNMTHHFVR